ncbi:asparaginase [Actinomadura sp. NBRC 104425]|uniref:asparaginase n=1 Tax=Actinomadura sp. NBRC 104425 TaxID=3032204 RepID=UPI0024A39C0A|nr:asparaginase [Actinomadura sp. NBRC 104425]GLZ14609.1 asparaginase [Actinomadura sp. NBRC 104425]
MVDTHPVLVEVERSGFVESRHRGSAVGLAADGSVAVCAGDPDAPVFPRSANKPMQAVAMLRAGLDLDGELLALAAGSHSGEDFHVEGARAILAAAGLDEGALRCPPDWPLELRLVAELARSGGDRSRLLMNCSGKHAAMLATCVAAGWPTASYLDPDHPLQKAVRATVEELAGERVAAVGVDGCGAPLFALSAAGVARAFRALVLAAPGTAERRVADAMRAHPQWTSGTRRDERRLMDAVPGLLVKCGAEGVDAFAAADGRAGVVKIDDGASRARTPVTVALLRALGVDAAEGVDAAALDELAAAPLTGGEQVVGTIRPAAGLFTAAR